VSSANTIATVDNPASSVILSGPTRYFQSLHNSDHILTRAECRVTFHRVPDGKPHLCQQSSPVPPPQKQLMDYSESTCKPCVAKS